MLAAMAQVQLTLVIHNHQPVGNFDHVFEQACERAYLPFLRTLLEFPSVRIGLHTSGCLWEWVEAHRPEYGRLVDELLARGQVELLGGGMYEPILPVLPARDALWQLRRMNRFLLERFGKAPVGAWIPERVWEPQLPELLAQAGLQYCLLDDYHFEGNAPPEQIATDYFLTDHAGSEVALLPISKQLRYTIPFKPASDTLEYLRTLRESAEQSPLAVFGDDGEKFGIWPDTYEWVFEQGWLREFLRALTDAQDWLQIPLPSEVLEQRQAAGFVYVPARSYFEMGEWTRVGTTGSEDFLPGHWRNFFSKYPESRQLFARVCEVSAALHLRGDSVSSEVWDHLGRAQCNCCYWHGVFGGLYLNYLRAALTRHLLQAETTAGGPRESNATRLSNDALSVTIHPESGLSVSRIDYYPTLFNWTDVVARRREEYHSKLIDAAIQAETDRA
jgi:alpha-amylase